MNELKSTGSQNSSQISSGSLTLEQIRYEHFRTLLQTFESEMLALASPLGDSGAR